MKKIKLTKGQYALVDDDDYGELNKYKWYCTSEGYAMRRDNKKNKFKVLSMHRVLMKARKGQQIDHINNNTVDNQRQNLRKATRTQNQGNQKMHKNNTSGYKGVCWHKTLKYWVAQLHTKKGKHYSVFCKTKEEAAKKYNEMATKYFGEYALLNKI